MNSRQKAVLLIGSILVALIVLFPPWEYFDPDSSLRRPAGHHVLFAPPPLKSHAEMFGVPCRFRNGCPDSVQIHKPLLILQSLFAILTVAGLLSLLAEKLTIIKMILGILFIGVGLFVLGFILSLNRSATKENGSAFFSHPAMLPTKRLMQPS
jgi:hypothetical protein